MAFRILLAKENFKFSCSHFTIFNEKEAEPLHGHNYYVSVELRLSNLDPLLGMAFDFNAVKPMIRAIASELDERVLIPSQSQYLVVKKKGDRIHATHAGRAYDLPQSDVRLLEVVNITSEELARYFAQKLQEKISEHKETAARITSLTVGIEETRGQSVFFDLSLSGML